MTNLKILQGILKGGIAKTDDGVEYYEFLGIPYAKPPLGELRFKSPQPPEPWHGERDATSVSENQISCMVNPESGSTVGSEDCLYLNVYTPQLPTVNKPLLPVIVFIHGGAFLYGSGIIKSESGPDFLVNHDVVVVTINYRLNIFGFLSLGIPKASGNMGLKDQIQALKWVQDNIEEFGGDKSNVTLHGISAGAASTEYLILSPSAKGLFHKAIIQSGSTLNHWAINYEPKKIVMSVLDEVGYNGSTEDNQEIYDYLLTVPAQTLVEASTKITRSHTNKRLFFGFVPTIEIDFGDGDAVITDNPYKLLQEGKINRVPILRGFCNREGFLTKAIQLPAISAFTMSKDFNDHWAYEFDASDKEKFNSILLSAYSKDIKKDDENDKMAIDFFSDYDFVAGILLSSEMIACQGIPIYLYQLSYDGEINYLKRTFDLKEKGTAHGDDIAYVLNTNISHLADERDKIVRHKITKMWTNFVKLSNPTPEDSELPIAWPQFNQESKLYLNIDEQFTIESNYEPEKMAIYDKIYNKYKK